MERAERALADELRHAFDSSSESESPMPACNAGPVCMRCTPQLRAYKSGHDNGYRAGKGKGYGKGKGDGYDLGLAAVRL